MLEKIFVDKSGYLWFKTANRSVWFDHPDPSRAKGARTDLGGSPQLGGDLLHGVLIQEMSSQLALIIAKAILEMKLPDYLQNTLKKQLEKVWEYVRGEFNSISQVFNQAIDSRWISNMTLVIECKVMLLMICHRLLADSEDTVLCHLYLQVSQAPQLQGMKPSSNRDSNTTPTHSTLCVTFNIY